MIAPFRWSIPAILLFLSCSDGSAPKKSLGGYGTGQDIDVKKIPVCEGDSLISNHPRQLQADLSNYIVREFEGEKIQMNLYALPTYSFNNKKCEFSDDFLRADLTYFVNDKKINKSIRLLKQGNTFSIRQENGRLKYLRHIDLKPETIISNDIIVSLLKVNLNFEDETRAIELITINPSSSHEDATLNIKINDTIVHSDKIPGLCKLSYLQHEKINLEEEEAILICYLKKGMGEPCGDVTYVFVTKNDMEVIALTSEDYEKIKKGDLSTVRKIDTFKSKKVEEFILSHFEAAIRANY